MVSLLKGWQQPVGYNALATALFARGTFSTARKAQVNYSINRAGTAPSKLDFWHMTNGESDAQSQLNWLSSSYNITKVGSPTFTVGRGYTGDGVAASLNTNFNASTAGGKYTTNDATAGVLILEPPSAAVQMEMSAQATSNTYIGSNGVAGAFLAINTAGSTNPGTSAALWQGLLTIVRRSASTVEVFCGKLSLGSFASTSNSLANTPFHYLSRSNETQNFSVRTVSAGFGGGALSATEIEAIDAAIRANMVATGGYLKIGAGTLYGNSLTFGTGASNQATTSYPAQLQGLYDSTVFIMNQGVAGRSTTDIINNIDTSTPYRVASQYPANKRVAILWELRNDLATGLTGSQAVDNYQTCCVKLRALGFDKVLVGNMIYDGSGGTTTQQRIDANTALASRWSSFADGLIDFVADTRLQNPNDTTYYNADKLHLTDAGYAVVAAIAKPALDAAFASI